VGTNKAVHKLWTFRDRSTRAGAGLTETNPGPPAPGGCTGLPHWHPGVLACLCGVVRGLAAASLGWKRPQQAGEMV